MLIIAVSSIAAALDQKSVVVNATVAPYAVITVTAEKIAFSPFSGAAGEVRSTMNNAGFSIETNTALDLRFSAGDLKRVHGNQEQQGVSTGDNQGGNQGGVSSLDTKYKVYKVIKNSENNPLGYFNKNANYDPKGDLMITQAAKTIELYYVNGTARTRSISSQEAGDYSATITVTASAH